MPSYSSLVSNKQFKGNVVIRIGGTGPFYTVHTPDADTLATIATEKNGYIVDFTENSQTLDVINARTTFASFTFKISDINNDITALYLGNPTIFSGLEVECWLGMIGESHDFQDYHKLQKTVISSVTFQNEIFTFTSKEVTERFKRPVFNVRDLLAADIAIGVVSLVAVEDISEFPASGVIKIDDEFVTYSAKVDLTKTFTVTATTAAHSAGADILNVVDVSAVNPIDFFLQFVTSGGGGGAYDVLSDGLGIASTELDISEIETAVRDASYSGELWDFRLYGIEDGLEFLQKEILVPCSTRIVFSENSLISLTVLDQVVFSTGLKLFNEDNIIPQSVSYVADDTKIYNVIKFFYDYNHSTGIYETVDTSNDTLSITRFGERKPLEIRSKGIKTASGGALISSDRRTRLLARHSKLTPRVTLKTFNDVHLARNGERVQLNYDLPSAIGTRAGFNYNVEIVKKSYSPKQGTVKYEIGFTGYTGIREGFISPTDHATVVNSQSSIDISSGRGLKWKVGWKVALYVDPYTREADAVNEIATISGDTVTFVDAFVTSLTTGHYIKFPNQTEIPAGGDQHRYAFLDNSGANFADGTAPYQITY